MHTPSPPTPVACATSRHPPPTLSHTNQRSVVTLVSPTVYKMAAAFLYHNLIAASDTNVHKISDTLIISATVGSSAILVAILDSRATHHL